MSDIVKLITVLALVAFSFSAGQLPDSPWRSIRLGRIIQTTNGKIQGLSETYGLFRRIHTYKGIPYAEPPIGNLRFRAPVPAISWTDTKNATQFGPNCPQSFGAVKGDEDCLYLNVFTPNRINSLLPVLIFIHGGGFTFGSGDTDLLGPETFIEENVIAVTINYRLGVLGFLNTGDRHCPGNFGLKDQILALRWVQENIQAFGGNPNSVTIMGSSAGSASVHALVLSPAASGLFHKAISQSGSLLSDWTFNYNPKQTIANIVRSLYLHVEDNEDLMRQLRKVSVERLVEAGNVFDKADPMIIERGSLVPSLDPIDSEETIIFPDLPQNLLKSGNISRVPYLLGFASVENLQMITVLNHALIERFAQNFNLFVPALWNLKPNSPEALEVILTFMDIYFNGSFNTTNDFGLRFINFVSDTQFIHGMSKQARLHSALQDVFFYRFSYSGSFNFMKRASELMEYPGAVHEDDLFYLLRHNRLLAPVTPNDKAFSIRRRHVRLWTNFVKYGVPTPVLSDPLINVNWPKATPENLECIDIGELMLQQNNPFADRMNMWKKFDDRFNP